MPFTVPNATSATDPLAGLDSGDLAIMAAASGQNGVLVGCAVSAGSGMQVVVASGTVLVNSLAVAVTGATLAIVNADVLYNRYDLVVASATGTLSVVTGTPLNTSAYPAIPVNSIVLAMVYVAHGVSSLSSSFIVDKRVSVRSPMRPGILIAASNASISLQYSADYVCSGTADQTIIQLAISTLPAGGGQILLSEGTFTLSADIVVPSNCTITGAGRSTILMAAAASSTNCLKMSGVSHVTIKDLTVNGNKANVTVLGIQYTRESGMYLQNSDDITIARCYIHDCAVSGIMANGGCTNLIVCNNRLVSCYDNQIYIRAQDTTPYTPCLYGTVTGNDCSLGSFSGIQFLGSSYFAATGNTCYSNGPTQAQGDGIGSEGGSHITISGNDCYNNGVQGINVRGTTEVGVTAQISSYITVSGNECYNNISQNGDAGGISITDAMVVTVSGNTISGNGFGINVTDVMAMGVNDCHVVGNTVKGSLNTGIRITPSSYSDIILQDNKVTDSAGDNVYTTVQIFVQGGIYARAAANKEGIHLATGSDKSFIDGGFFYDNRDNGILIDSPVAGVEIRNSQFNNYLGTAQHRAIQEQSGAGPTRVVNCRIINQGNNPYTFNNPASAYYDEQSYAIKSITTATYTVGAHDEVVLCNVGSACTVTLPNANNASGRALTVKDKSGGANTNNITISGANNIDGAASKVINTAYGVARLVCDGNNWFLI